MSKQYPECPLYNHATCRELHNPKLCAIIREDKICLKKQQKPKKEALENASANNPDKKNNPDQKEISNQEENPNQENSSE